jgi:predicted nicotinamide N-methyase
LRLRVEDNFIIPVISHFAVYVGKEWRIALLEMFVHVDVVSFGVADLLEAIHIELSDEGGKVVVFKVSRQHLLSEACDVLDIKAVPRGGPAHRFPEFFVLG